MMLYSAETRWFIPERLPDEVLNWFKGGMILDSEEVRVHEYLLFPDCESVGVKLREGRLEIKAICGPSQPIKADLGVRGHIERWTKWSLPIDGMRTLDVALHQSDRWMKVHKERFLRRFSAEQGRPVEVTKRQGYFPTVGCNVEVTRIEVDADPQYWFTIGFEAFGPPSVTRRILDEALLLFFEEHGRVPGSTLGEDESTGYPAWLAKLTKTSSG